MRRNLRPIIAALMVCTATIPAALAAETASMTLLSSEAAVQWQPAPANLPRGSQIAVLEGDPSKPGPFSCA